MRIAEYKQIGTNLASNSIMVDDYNDDGEIIGRHEEMVAKEVPVMGMVYRDMTPEEEAEALAEQERMEAEMVLMPPTIEQRMDSVEEHNTEQDMTIDDMVLLMADMIGGM